MDRPIFIDNVLGLQVASMRQIVDIVKRTYCGTFALQYMHISDPEAGRMAEGADRGLRQGGRFTREGRKAILNKMVEAEGFEKFLHVKYMGTKRFGLDGGESLIPAMEQIIKRGGALGVKEVVFGMPHRGRLSVLANVMGKALPRDLQRVPGRQLQARGRGWLGRREIPPRRLVGPRVRRQLGAPVADGEPLASRGGEPRRPGQGPRQAGPDR
jgi:2-oxoglutarate dehydrogenase complex dehydrogenase (E1) component-like enzyme